MSDIHALALRVYVGAFVDELARCGVTDVCICPGSRSTPLALLIREHPALKVWTHLDERSAGFFALGMAKASRKAVAVLCTSGTAAANFMPAVAEAHNGQVPLIVLTADRPQELREVGALQTIDQVRMYGSHAKWATEMLLPEATDAAARHARSIADRAVATALSSPRGPVHLNFPFREPLIPAVAGPDPGASERTDSRAQVQASQGEAERMVPDPLVFEEAVSGSARGLIVCGGQDGDPNFASWIARLAMQLQVPVLTDVLSQVRSSEAAGVNLIDQADAFLRDSVTCTLLEPDYVIRFGATPVSKPLQQFLARRSIKAQFVVASVGTWPDPDDSATQLVWGNPYLAFNHMGAIAANSMLPAVAEKHAWLDTWREVNNIAGEAVETTLAASDRMSEPLVFRRLADLVPENATVFAGNSMPVRDLDSFWPASTKKVRFMANRGASGIDGVVSTALGVAAASDGPVVLVIGDISLYHDMNGLLAVRRHQLNATIVVINNDGGGIFSFLPQAARGDHFEELFGTPHGLDFKHTAALYGLDYCLAQTPDDFDAAVAHSLKSEGVSLIEVRTNRDENLALHRKIWADVAAALAESRQ
jgi:2-succinyl-5-enolpyruvyl-6-hydroxy-3-cyclohexene-1-carboxylate synthase